MNRPDDPDAVVRGLLHQPRPVAVDPARAARVRPAVHAAWKDARLRTRLRRGTPGTRHWKWAALAAAAVVAVAIAVTLVNSLRERGVPQATAPIASTLFATGEVVFAQNDIHTNGGHAAVALPNGVELRLDSDTALTIDTARRVTLTRGAIYLDSSNRTGPPEPIEIVARGSVIRDIGTRYEVRLSDQELRVRVRDGRVEVATTFGTREANRGGQLRVTSTGILSGRTSTSGADWDWIVRAIPPPQLEGRPLPEFLEWAEREGGRPIRFADPALEKANRETIVYGSIDSLTVEEALDVVLPSCGLARRTDGEVITIVAADETRGVK